MKKIFLTVLPTLLLIFVLFSCGGGGSDGHIHSFTEENSSPEFLATEADCKSAAAYYYSCSCGVTGYETFTVGESLAHDYTAQCATEENIAAEATCQSAAMFYYCCTMCGESGSETFKFDGELGPHKTEMGECVLCGLPESSPGLEFVLDDNGKSYILTGIGSCTDTDIIIGSYNNLGVSYVENNVFSGCDHIKSVTIGNSVETIGASVFSGCSGLKSIVIPDSVVSLGEWAFGECTGLESLTIGGGNIAIGSYTFYKCESLTEVSLPEGVFEIGTEAFGECTSLHTLRLPKSIRSIEWHAFRDCKSLSKVYVPDLYAFCNITFEDNPLGNGADLYVDGKILKDLVIPSGIEKLGDYAFLGCTSLDSVVIPDSVSSLGVSVFNGCVNLKSVTLSNSLTSIGDYQFENCRSLQSVTIPDSVVSLMSAFNDCIRLKEVTLGRGLTSIGSGVFKGCESLESVSFANPDGWECTSAFGESTVPLDGLRDAEIAADYLKNTYLTYSWSRSE